ncbi:8-oxo-dGTP diphosphatase [Sneathia vaginalis]|jgi:hydrolase, NUDIX family|nr:8-oxo-dGTP diphosphatase [Sneathia vaginalis]
MTICTVCYIEKDDEVLMLYRNKKENDINEGKWIGVGGHVEKNESPYDCIVREVKEETGLDVYNLIPRGHMTFIFNNDVTYIHVFSTRDFKGSLIDCDEGELHWIKKSDIKKLNLWETDAYLIEKIVNNDYSYFMTKAEYSGDKLLLNKVEVD